METTRIAQQSLLRFPSDTVNRFSRKCHVDAGDFKASEKSGRLLARLSTRFSDSGHQPYYVSPIKEFKKKKENNSEVKVVKKKLKFIKRLSNDLSLFSLETSGKEMGNSLIDEAKISGTVELLQAQLQQLRSQRKELKRQMKEKKAQNKTTLKQTKAKCKSNSSSSSSSESSDSENGEEIDINRLRSNVLKHPRNSEVEKEIKEGRSTICSLPVQQKMSEETLGIGDLSYHNHSQGRCPRGGDECSSSNGCSGEQRVERISDSGKRIEICMGGKCKKLGAEALLREFDKKVGAEFAVSGCKCLGKCKDGPNLRVVNTPNEDQAMTTRMLRPSINSLCIGVGLEDVDVILANILGEHKNNNYLMVHSPSPSSF